MVRKRYPAHPAQRSLKTYSLIGLAFFALGACARPDGGALPLVNARVVDAPFVESDTPNTRRHEFKVAQGAESIALTEWLPEGEPRAVILGVHGYGDYGASTFGKAAEDWAERGIVTYAYDQRGFGRNPSNSDWPGSNALLNDLGVVSRLVQERHPSLPLTIVGHSMGGGVVTAALGEGIADPHKAVLLAPAVWGGDNLNPFLRGLAHTANAFAPDKRWTGDGIVRIQASDNIEMLLGLGRDPLYVRSPSSREFVGLIRVMDRAVEAADAVETPVLVFYGAKDEVLPEEPILDVYESFKGPKEYRKVETGWHMLLRDLNGDIVRDAVAEFALDDGVS